MLGGIGGRRRRRRHWMRWLDGALPAHTGVNVLEITHIFENSVNAGLLLGFVRFSLVTRNKEDEQWRKTEWQHLWAWRDLRSSPQNTPNQQTRRKGRLKSCSQEVLEATNHALFKARGQSSDAQPLLLGFQKHSSSVEENKAKDPQATISTSAARHSRPWMLLRNRVKSQNFMGGENTTQHLVHPWKFRWGGGRTASQLSSGSFEHCDSSRKRQVGPYHFCPLLCPSLHERFLKNLYIILFLPSES